MNSIHINVQFFIHQIQIFLSQVIINYIIDIKKTTFYCNTRKHSVIIYFSSYLQYIVLNKTKGNLLK